MYWLQIKTQGSKSQGQESTKWKYAKWKHSEHCTRENNCAILRVNDVTIKSFKPS